MENFNFKPKGVCSRNISFDIVEGKLHNVHFEGGCDGNLKAISMLLEGQDAERACQILRGNTCGFRNTSCADQLAQGVEQAIREAQA